ncbi:hypothetical protein TrCOL_g4201 [Triparma columacea]|uniref:uracil phosphoribosyltransferase n=1 Tax=Triparma columacea TaxID=722753 RepID=A0A9W7L460_9STRA|nr:hypothetical protein TrCOL_g4201 [Triparma columacea]
MTTDLCYASGHPVLAHKLSVLRSDQTAPAEFRRVLREITFYLGYEATASLNLRDVSISTPTAASATGKKIDDTIALIPIMRAGLGMVEPMLELLPNADVHHIGMYRSKDSLLPIQYYNKLPRDKSCDVAYVLDPMIATAGTITAVVNILKKWGAKKIHIISVLASKAGLQKLQDTHPDVHVTVTEVDDILSKDGMIIPGLGDAGNRLYKTPTIDQDDDEKLLSPSKRKRTLSK